MRIHIKNGRIVDPATGKDGVGDLHIADGKISESFSNADKTIDAKGLVVSPGFIDLSARLREPGFEYKATLESETEAAVGGGGAGPRPAPAPRPPPRRAAPGASRRARARAPRHG